MLRRLLACLALLTGLTAVGVPTHAQVVAGLAAQVEASEEGVTAPARQAAAAPHAYDYAAQPVDCQLARPAPASSMPLAAAVRTGIDRSRE